jgi:hypothetical protein
VQPTKVGTPVLVAEEARRAVVAALYDARRQAVVMDACAAGHGAQAWQKLSLAPFPIAYIDFLTPSETRKFMGDAFAKYDNT